MPVTTTIIVLLSSPFFVIVTALQTKHTSICYSRTISNFNYIKVVALVVFAKLSLPFDCVCVRVKISASLKELWDNFFRDIYVCWGGLLFIYTKKKKNKYSISLGITLNLQGSEFVEYKPHQSSTLSNIFSSASIAISFYFNLAVRRFTLQGLKWYESLKSE